MTEPARSFQHYEVLRRDDGTPWELGHGSMGVTYKAFDVNLCCEVALKVVSSTLVEHPEARERFVREARAAAALRHRNVASVYHLGNDGEHFFYAMEFISGETLDALVRRDGPLSVADTLRVVLQVARALAAAARQGLVHRDIKPANLMVTHEDADEETVVKVIDFGLARPAAAAENSPPLTIGGFVGTPQFASPEQLEERPLDARSDLYSLGVTAWFLLTGRVPFAGSLATVCQQQLTKPPPWDHLPTTLPPCVRDLIAHLLEKDAARRPQSAAELRGEIEACLDHVQGAERRRQLHLAAPPSTAFAGGKPAPKPAGRAVQVGAMLNGRYRLLREIGESHGIRVYQARDESNGDRLVAVKILPVAPASSGAVVSRWEEDVRLAQAAAHPGLVQIYSCARCLCPEAMFVVEEWLAGFTLRELVAGRGGAVPVAEALRLLEQAAAAADHAESCRLEPLDLSATEWHVSFPSLAAADAGPQARAFVATSMAEWPEWSLKIQAFRTRNDPRAVDTWAGADTLLPVIGGSSPGPYLQALAGLLYELLGGKPFQADGRPARPGSLPVLNEEANLLLKRALSGESGLVHGRELYEALTEAIGVAPARADVRLPIAGPLPLPLAAAVPVLPVPARDGAATLPGFAQVAETRDDAASARSVADYFEDEHDPAGRDDPQFAEAGTAWDRLTLVTAQRTHPGRWLAGTVGLAAVFGLVFVGVLAWLWQQPPARGPAPLAKKRTPQQAAPASRATLHQGTPPPLALAPVSTPTPRPTVIPSSAAPPPVSSPALVREETLPPPPAASPAATPSVSVPTPARDRFTMVRLESIPPGAQIRLGDEVLGTTPCRIRLPRGDHQLIARYQDWPETRQTVHLDGTETRLTVEIRLMRPDLVPGLVATPAVSADSRARRIAAPAARRVPHAEAPEPFGSPPRDTSEPEVRPAQRVLTPFQIDEPAAAALPSPTPGNSQPFSAGDGGDD